MAEKSVYDGLFLTDAQLKSELAKCEFCEEKPCKAKCPCDCSAADFIMAAGVFSDSDIKRSAAQIMKKNPLGGICGMVCPDRFCVAACVHKKFDSAVNIPAVQATIIKKARELGGIAEFSKPKSNGKKVAIIGSGPAGLGAASVLGSLGYKVDIYEKENSVGGMANLIPEYRLDKKMLKEDIKFLTSLGDINIKLNSEIENPESLLTKCSPRIHSGVSKANSYDAVLSATGLTEPIKMAIENENLALVGLEYLKNPKKYKLKCSPRIYSGVSKANSKVAVIGGGATAADAAMTAKLVSGASNVEMFALETVGEMPLTLREMTELLENNVEITGRTRVTAILKKGKLISGLETVKVSLPEGVKFNLKDLKELPGTKQVRNDISTVIIAIGARSKKEKSVQPSIFYAGDSVQGPTTVVEATAAGKNAAAEIDAFINGLKKPVFDKKIKSDITLKGYTHIPVSLETDFFGRKISTPFLLSAAPPSDGYDQMKKAYEAGWSGGVMKTSFDNVPIHIPGEYMHAFNDLTYGNCDNVSGHHLDRVCREVQKLIKEYPARLTMASTGGPVTGNDENDKRGWQSNTKKLEAAGVMGIEYSLSCPQGGDGTEGDIVSQNAALTAKIIDWVMDVSNPEIPKLFKLTAAVTSIVPIVNAIKKVFAKYPNKKAGITLANTFPTLYFRPRKMNLQNEGFQSLVNGANSHHNVADTSVSVSEANRWEEGIVVGMSGDGVTPISYLTLASVSSLGVAVSGNGGPMDYKAAMNFLALGVKTVQFCTIVTKHGYGVFDELVNGTSYLMKERGIKSMKELIGIALPKPITGFMDLTPVKKISSCDTDVCLICGNCSRCPYQAISLDKDKHPVTDAEKCIGCSICVQKCFSGALSMRDRTPEEKSALKED
ncbi:MAG: dihydropyrimidine dehydrogenase [Elusimicrobia bacterium CG06_land_8_20_14_3_00_38_11]|nr:MAG: dihydropyrimidine dehydrogenase [Elusimicrobia bacterium CG06_land_8_20_14_3_00_38_11]